MCVCARARLWPWVCLCEMGSCVCTQTSTLRGQTSRQGHNVGPSFTSRDRERFLHQAHLAVGAHPGSLEMEPGPCSSSLSRGSLRPTEKGLQIPSISHLQTCRNAAKSFGICFRAQSQLTGLFPAWKQGEGTWPRKPQPQSPQPPQPHPAPR